MRCTSCGTENEPNSRFCGGCGAKLAQPQARLAPTAKISDDAPYPPAGAVSTGARPQVSYQSPPPGFNPHAPASIPPTRPPTPIPQESFSRAVTPAMQTPPPGALGRAPTAQRPDSQPPTQQRQPVRPAASMADSVVAPPSRPIGLMVAILIVDLGLAAAGAVMLGKGLSAKKAKPADKVEQKDSPKTGATPVQKSEATPPPASPAPAMQPASASPSMLGGAAAEPAKVEPAKVETAKVEPAKVETAKVEAKSAKTSGTRGKDKDAAKTAHASTTTGTAKPTTSGPVTHPSAGNPEDPYADAQVAFDLNTETTTLAAKSKSSFARCEAREVHGAVNIAFQVMPDGSVQHATAVENTTGDDALARCLASTISAWRYSPHAGAVVNFMRPFNYP